MNLVKIEKIYDFFGENDTDGLFSYHVEYNVAYEKTIGGTYIMAKKAFENDIETGDYSLMCSKAFLVARSLLKNERKFLPLGKENG